MLLLSLGCSSTAFRVATVNPPLGEEPPLCQCGCGGRVRWAPGKGWCRYKKVHYSSKGKPGSRLGATTSAATRRKQSEAATRRYAGIRRRDLDPTGLGVYSTKEYQKAREQLVKGRTCSKCGTDKDVCAHHVIPGDDSSLIPLCRGCHPTAHARKGAKGQQPPPGTLIPLCACGCGLPVRWKRYRGWAKFRKGHGSAKVSGKIRLAEPPLCKCGCGEPVKYRHGKGWGEYRHGHRQRVEGHYTAKRKRK